MPDPLRSLVEWLGAGTAEAAPLTPDDEAALETVAGRFPRFAAAVKATRPTMRAATLMERVNDRVQDAYEAVAAQPLGRVADALGMTDFAGMVRSAAEPVGLMGSELTPGPKPKGIRAFHGSPHDFDKFSLQKIGTGEGAQAYGHGLYFAEQEGTAKAYRDQLSKFGHASEMPEDMATSVLLDNVVVSGRKPSNQLTALERAALSKHYARGNQQQAIVDVEDSLKYLTPGTPAHQLDLETLQVLKSTDLTGRVKPFEGRMYEVNIKADPDQFLDWDAPLSQQNPDVRQSALQAYGDVRPVQLKDGRYAVTLVGGDQSGRVLYAVNEATPEAAMDAFTTQYSNYMTGSDVYHDLMRFADRNPGVASNALKAKGIPGIKYLDQNSRGGRAAYRGDRAYLSAAESFKSAGHSVDDALAGLRHAYKGANPSELQAAIHEAYDITPQTRNFVVFDDATIEILKKYGLLLPVVGAAMQAQRETRK